jgi:hypothetical protein
VFFRRVPHTPVLRIEILDFYIFTVSVSRKAQWHGLLPVHLSPVTSHQSLLLATNPNHFRHQLPHMLGNRRRGR